MKNTIATATAKPTMPAFLSADDKEQRDERNKCLSRLFAKFQEDAKESEQIAMIFVLRSWVMEVSVLDEEDRETFDALGPALQKGSEALDYQYNERPALEKQRARRINRRKVAA